MKVVVKLMGGLANQMFQYSFGKYISRKTGRDLILDLSFLKNREIPETNYFVYRNYDLDIFDIDPKKVDTFDEECEIISEPWGDFFKFQKNLVERALNSTSENIYLDGYWGSFKYFGDEEILDFTFKKDLLENSKDLLKSIISTDSVMIHVRRTDFLNNPLLLTIGRDYVEKAVEEIGKEGKSFYIFSDDPQWCREKLSHIGTIIGEEHNGVKNSNCLRLMSHCKNFIISNSTFGWWSAYLSKNKGKVLYPARVYEEGFPSVPEGWNPPGWKGILN